MKYLIIPTEHGYRISTVAYKYRLARVGTDVFRLHWHPGGVSDVAYPHAHIAVAGTPQPAINLLTAHLPTPRMTFEQSVRWAAELGFPMQRADYLTILDESEANHLAHRSWDVDPASPRVPPT